MNKGKTLIILLLLLFSFSVQAQEKVDFYFIHPGGEGSADDAKPYLSEFFAYLNEQTGKNFQGIYLNDLDDAVEALTDEKVDMAIVSPSFLLKFKNKFLLQTVLKTIPAYSSGPYEKYFIMTNQDTDITKLASSHSKVKLYTAQEYSKEFLNETIFGDNDAIKKISWQLLPSPDITTTIKEIAAGNNNTFVLLSGYEFSVVNALRKKNPAYQSLKLAFSSSELPSSSLVIVGDKQQNAMEPLKQALLKMPKTLGGNIILKRLRLKGFTE
ncbi:MAG: PhnD/SsuA/transferrin family substrate-binding protein [bacterium]